MQSIRFADIVNGANVRMIKCGGRFGFSSEALQALPVVCHFLRQEFKRHEAVQPRVLFSRMRQCEMVWPINSRGSHLDSQNPPFLTLVRTYLRKVLGRRNFRAYM